MSNYRSGEDKLTEERKRKRSIASSAFYSFFTRRLPRMKLSNPLLPRVHNLTANSTRKPH